MTEEDVKKSRAEWETDPTLMVTISNVNRDGKFKMYFNRDLIVPSIFDEDGYPRKFEEKPKVSAFQKKQKELSAFQKKQKEQGNRRLKSNDTKVEEEQTPKLDITQYVRFWVYPGSSDSSFGK